MKTNLLASCRSCRVKWSIILRWAGVAVLATLLLINPNILWVLILPLIILLDY